MQIGTKLIAPEGYLNLSADGHFFFLVNSTRNHQALLARIERGTREWDAHLVALTQREFERGVLSGQIVEAQDQPSVPPHLEGLEGVDFRTIETQRAHAKKSNLERAQERFLAIAEYVNAWPEIVAAEKPESFLNKMVIARGQTPRRIRFWLLSYLCFGRSELALYPAFARIGHYDRTSDLVGSAYGRPVCEPDLLVTQRLSKEDIALIEKSFVALARKSMPLTKIYAQAMIRFFHALTELAPDGNRRYISPTGSVLPTINQYRYRVRQLFSAHDIRVALYDKNLARRKSRNKGSFRETNTNFMEVVECDGFFPREKPCSSVSQKELDAICVVRGICATTSQIVGIGFSLNGEHSDAYWMMLFSMAIDKKTFCALFGIDIDESEWVGKGLPLRVINDRGPGSTLYNRIDSLGPKRRTHTLPIREMTPSGSGQSKATIEGNHPKVLRLEQPNVYVKSEKTVWQLAASEIYQCLYQNESHLLEDGYTATLARNNVRPTPNAVAAFLIKVGRTDAQQMAFDAAVREFLPRTTVTLTRDGAEYQSILYKSEALIEAASSNRTRKLNAYYIPVCLRHIWVELGGQLLQLDNESIYNGGTEDAHLSDTEALELKHVKRRNRRKQEKSRNALRSQRMLNEEKSFGRPYKEPEVVTRQSQRTPKATAHEREAHRAVFQGTRK